MTKKLSKEKIAEIRKVYSKGNSLRKTGEICGVYLSTVFNYTRDISHGQKYRKAWNKGKKCPQISRGKKGKKLSIEHRLNLSKSHLLTK